MNSLFQLAIGCLAATGTRKGLGVFATRRIRSGETVEIAPVILLRSDFGSLDPEIQRRVFDWERLSSAEGVSAFALGYGSMYNHANPANVRYGSDLDGEAIRFTAARDIEAGEELTINYNGPGGDVESNEEVWFSSCGVEPVVNE